MVNTNGYMGNAQITLLSYIGGELCDGGGCTVTFINKRIGRVLAAAYNNAVPRGIKNNRLKWMPKNARFLPVCSIILTVHANSLCLELSLQ